MNTVSAVQLVRVAQTVQAVPGLRALRVAAALVFTAAAGAQTPPDRGPPTPLPAVPAVPAATAVTASDGRHLLRAQGDQLQVKDNTGHSLRTWPVRDLQGHAGTVLAVFDAPPRRSFVVVLRDLAELWELSYDPNAEPIFDGWVHDYRMGEGLAQPGYLGIRRTRLARPLAAVFFDARVPWLVGAEAGEPPREPPHELAHELPQEPSHEPSVRAPATALTAVVIHLDIRRAMVRLPLPATALPPLQGTQLWHDGERWLLRLPAAAGWTDYDTQRWLLQQPAPR